MAKLPKLAAKWNANIAVTAHGTPAPHHPKHPLHLTKKEQVSVAARSSFTEKWLVTFVKQTGQHLEVTVQSPRYKGFLVGTISADGKFVQIVGEYLTWTLHIDDKSMSGVGTARNTHTGHFAAQTIIMTPAK